MKMLTLSPIGVHGLRSARQTREQSRYANRRVSLSLRCDTDADPCLQIVYCYIIPNGRRYHKVAKTATVSS